MSEYIERGALLALFESAEEDDIELYGVHISDCFPAERASEIANTLPAADVVEVKHALGWERAMDMQTERLCWMCGIAPSATIALTTGQMLQNCCPTTAPTVGRRWMVSVNEK